MSVLDDEPGTILEAYESVQHQLDLACRYTAQTRITHDCARVTIIYRVQGAHIRGPTRIKHEARVQIIGVQWQNWDVV